ncbi:hypothetical protein J6A34_08445 [bacterium]|nr:hypothetical protein [bacterium]
MNNLTFGKILVLILLIIALVFVIINYFNHTYIKAEFNDMDPLPDKMGVYYKGYKLGSTSKIKISKDFKTTYLFITLNQRGLELPKNITVSIKQYDKDEEDSKYVDINYPSAPMLSYIKTGDTIKGLTQNGINPDGISETNQQHLDNLSAKGESFLASAKETSDSLTSLFDMIYSILDENKENIQESTTSFKNSMKNLENLTTKINNGITEDMIKNSTHNIETTTLNLANSTNEFVSMSGNFNKSSSEFKVLVPKLSKLIDTIQLVICNTNEIILGIKNTLKQRFGGARIIFGKPIKE